MVRSDSGSYDVQEKTTAFTLYKCLTNAQQKSNNLETLTDVWVCYHQDTVKIIVCAEYSFMRASFFLSFNG